MKKAIFVTGAALVVAPLAVVGGYYGLQAYLDWLIKGATRPPVAGAGPANPSVQGPAL